MFMYCNNNPVNYFDSTGDLPCQNNMRMTMDCGGSAKYHRISTYYSGIDTDKITWEWEVDTNWEMMLYSLGKMAGIASDVDGIYRGITSAADDIDDIGKTINASKRVANDLLFESAAGGVELAINAVETMVDVYTYSTEGVITPEYTIYLSLDPIIDSIKKVFIIVAEAFTPND